MNIDEETCICGQRFADLSAYRRHEKLCKKLKVKTTSLVERFRAAKRNRKRRELDAASAEQELAHLGDSVVDVVEVEEVAKTPAIFQDFLPHIRGLQSAVASEPTGESSVSTDQLGTGRPKRSAAGRHLPKRYRDLVPEGPSTAPDREIPQLPQEPREPEQEIPTSPQLPPRRTLYRTLKNAFGVFREYLREPRRIPDAEVSLAQLTIDRTRPERRARSLTKAPTQPAQVDPEALEKAIRPFPNITTYRLAHWFHNGGVQKSREDLNRLVKDVLLMPDYQRDHLTDSNMANFDKALDKLDASKDKGADSNGDNDADPDAWEDEVYGDGWKEETVKIEIPTGVKQSSARPPGPASISFDVPGLLRRSLTEVIKVACQDNSARDFHFEPFKSFHEETKNGLPTGVIDRVYDELYSSDAWLEEQKKLDQSVPEPDCDLPRVIAALMFWSDATHVSQFGQSKMWPIYLFFGNLSKWFRCKPNARACHHVAHIPSLPDDIQDFFRAHSGGKSASPEVLRHCRRELFHGVWGTMLDAEFLEAYAHGIVIDCADGIKRRVYPRIFTYSADYPEKVLLATIRDLGGCPCPLCLVTRDQIRLLGLPTDAKIRTEKCRVDDEARQRKVNIAQKLIYKDGFVPGNERGEYFLKAESLVATKNAFSTGLMLLFGFNFFAMLAVDLLHEVELGVWKALFIHLVRILYTQGQNTVNEFNRRFRHIGNFGRSTIRSFAYMNVTDMKNWAARTYEDCLQCCIPCFDGLLPEPSNSDVRRLLYTLALWHGLAKLRQHTNRTLDYLEHMTHLLGKELRYFESTVCPRFNTVETPKESAARQRRELSRAAKSSKASKGKAKATNQRTFSLRTIKLHLLGHYVSVIRRFGTTDSYSTQVGELEHRVVKSMYRRGNRKRGFVSRAAQMQRRSQHLHRITNAVNKLGVLAGHKRHSVDRATTTPLPPLRPDLHFQVAESTMDRVHLGAFVTEAPNDFVRKTFIDDLKDHILGRLLSRGFDGSEGIFSDEERAQLIIFNNSIYRHSFLRLNYTTYNIHRDQDVVNPKIPSRSFVMVPASEAPHPFWYARVIGIFHAQVIYAPTKVYSPQRFTFLWVRWLGDDTDPNKVGSFTKQRLHRVGYVPESPTDSFGFLDPSVVIRSAHLIPAFEFGFSKKLLSVSSYWDTSDGDWESYYINPFVDRDMLIRHLQCGIGHSSGLPAVEIVNMDDTGLPTDDQEAEAASGMPEDEQTPSEASDESGDEVSTEGDEEIEGENSADADDDDDDDDLREMDHSAGSDDDVDDVEQFDYGN